MNNSPHSHANAKTTPAIRYAIQTAPPQMTNTELARRFNISPTTVSRWRKRQTIMDRSSAPKEHGRKKLSEKDLVHILHIRKEKGYGLDKLLETINKSLKAPISRSRLAQILKENKSILQSP
jgi:transposase